MVRSFTKGLKRVVVAAVRFVFSRAPLRPLCGHWFGWIIDIYNAKAKCHICGRIDGCVAVRIVWNPLLEDVRNYRVRYRDVYEQDDRVNAIKYAANAWARRKTLAPTPGDGPQGDAPK